MSKRVDKNEWPINLYRAIVYDDKVTENNLPADFRGAIEYVLIATLEDRETQILRYRYQMGLTYPAIGDKYGLQGARVRQIHDNTIRKLRHPARLCLLRNGILEEMKRYRENCREIFFNQGYREGYRNGSMEARASSLDDLKTEQTNNLDIPIEQAPIDVLETSVRVYNCLRRANICTVGQLLGWSKSEVLRIRNFGRLSLLDLEHRLDNYGLKLRDE